MVDGTTFIAATRLVVTETGGIVDVDHQHNLIIMIGLTSVIPKVGTIVEHADCGSRTMVKIIDVNIILADGQQVHIVTGVSRSVSSSDYLSRIWACSTGATFIHLLHEEVRPVGILISKIGISLEIGLHTLFLTLCQGIGYKPATKACAISHICPFIGISVFTASSYGSRTISCSCLDTSSSETPVLIRGDSSKFILENLFVGL